MKHTWQTVGALALALAGVACSGKQVAVAPPPEASALVGTWKLNANDSDNPEDALGAMQPGAEGQRRGGRGRGGFGGMGGGRPGGFGGGRGGIRPGGGSRPNFDAMRAGMQYARRAPQSLTLSESDSTVVFTADGGTPQVFHPDGRTTKEETDLGLKMKTKVHWQGRDLVIQRDWGSGVKLSEAYFRSQDTGQLFVIESLRTPRGSEPITFRRVYDRVGGTP